VLEYVGQLPVHQMTAIDLRFQPATYPPEAFSYQSYMARLGVTKAQAKQLVQKLKREKVWSSDTHQVAVQGFLAPAPFGGGTWLSIKRRDREPITERAVLGQIMRTLLPGHSGFELVPAPSRLVDSANQFHIWSFPSAQIAELRNTTLGLAQAHSRGISYRELEFLDEGQRWMVALPLEGRDDWREIFDFKEELYPGCEAALYFDESEQHPLHGQLVCLIKPGLQFPFGFKHRLVADDTDPVTQLIGAKQRSLSGYAQDTKSSLSQWPESHE
jgi:hypothetical protein